MIKIYTTSKCPYCEQTRNYLASINKSCQVIDISEDLKLQHYILEKTNQMGVPVIEIGGRFVVGFDKEKIDELIETNEFGIGC